MKQSKVCHDALDTSHEISKLIRFSPKRNAALDRIKIENPGEEESGPSHGIRSFCPTRWTVRGDAIESILDNYEALQRLWDECLETKLEPDVKVASLVSRHRCCTTTLCLVCNWVRRS